MEEILTLRSLLLKGDIESALTLVIKLEEKSRDDKSNGIESCAVILLLHLIKQQAEKRTTRSWDILIRNSICAIQKKEMHTCWRILLEGGRTKGCFRRGLSWSS